MFLKVLGDCKGIRCFGDFLVLLDEVFVYVVLVSFYFIFIVCRDFVFLIRFKFCLFGFFFDCRNNLMVICLMLGFVGMVIFGL